MRISPLASWFALIVILLGLHGTTFGVYMSQAWKHRPARKYVINVSIPESYTFGTALPKITLTAPDKPPNGEVMVTVLVSADGDTTETASPELIKLTTGQRIVTHELKLPAKRSANSIFVELRSPDSVVEFKPDDRWEIKVSSHSPPQPPVRLIVQRGEPKYQHSTSSITIELSTAFGDASAEQQQVDVAIVATSGAEFLKHGDDKRLFQLTKRKPSEMVSLAIVKTGETKSRQISFRFQSPSPNVTFAPDSQVSILLPALPSPDPPPSGDILILLVDTATTHLRTDLDFPKLLATFSESKKAKLVYGSVVIIRPDRSDFVAGQIPRFDSNGFEDGQAIPVADKIIQFLANIPVTVPVAVVWPAVIDPDIEGGHLPKMTQDRDIDVLMWWGPGGQDNRIPHIIEEWLPHGVHEMVYKSKYIFEKLGPRVDEAITR